MKRILKPRASSPLVIHGCSQGTATALNYVAQHPVENLRALVLESVLASGNSAIVQTITGPIMGLGFLKYVPGIDYMMPYAAKVFLWAVLPVVCRQLSLQQA